MCIRLAHPYRGPSHFPAVAPRAFDLKLQQRTDFEAEDGTCIALGEPALQRLASENPVATTAVFRHLLSNVRTDKVSQVHDVTPQTWCSVAMLLLARRCLRPRAPASLPSASIPPHPTPPLKDPLQLH